MLARVNFFRHHIPILQRFNIRKFLSEEFKCASEWNSRLSTPILQKVNLDSLYYDIEQGIQQKGKPSAIDVDIFVNKITGSDSGHTEETLDLLHKLRLSDETSNTLDSTGHAVIRNFVEMGNIPELLNILDDRLNYGVFLDNYTASYVLDYLIKQKDFHSATKVATFLMLQEDFDNELSRALSLYVCCQYLNEDVKPFYEKPEVTEEKEKKPKEEKKIRVKYLRNEFFDDHFDLRDTNHLIGKTLILIGRKMSSTPIGNSVEILGLILYQKYERALKTLQNIKTPSSFYKEIILKCLKTLENVSPPPTSEEDQKLYEELRNGIEKLSSSDKLNSAEFKIDLEEYVKNAVKRNASLEMENQKKIYQEWNKLREQRLNEELERLRRIQRLEEIEQMQNEMKTEEEKLWFFENEDKIDLQIDSKKVYYPKRWFGKKKKPRVVDEDYIPPEITVQRK